MKHARLHLLVLLPLLLIGSTAQSRDPKEKDAAFTNWRNRPDEPFRDGAAMFEKVKAELLKNYYDKGLKEEDLYRAAIEGMLSNSDPAMADWNKLLSPAEYAEMHSDIEGKVVGVGVEIGFNENTGYADVLNVIPGTPAAKAGILRGDQILRIDGKSFKGKQIRDMVYAIRGKVDSEVRLAVLHDAEIKNLRIKRESLPWDPVKSSVLPGDIGLLTIRTFTEGTPKALRETLRTFEKKGVKSLIIDLRANDGGLLERTIESTEIFIPKGQTIVRLLKRDQPEEVVNSKTEPLLKGIPIVLLMNSSTKSGAEIMAAALKMSRGATTIGTHSYGKWSAQRLDELPNKFAIKYTIATFLPPNGKHLGGKGLEPDIPVEMPEELAWKLQSQPDINERLKDDVQLLTAYNIAKMKAGEGETKKP